MTEQIFPTDAQGNPLGPARDEVVRCRDCVYITRHRYSSGLEYQTCSYFDSAYAEIELNGFCAWGERRGE